MHSVTVSQTYGQTLGRQQYHDNSRSINPSILTWTKQRSNSYFKDRAAARSAKKAEATKFSDIQILKRRSFSTA